jgi:RimJ/RimL family protein N-acetyltransferase
MMVLETERLVLRTLEGDDALFYLELVNSPDFIANIGDRGLRTLEAAREAIEQGPMAMQQARGHSIYLVQRKDNGRAVGMSGLIKRDTLDDVDLGYAFLPEASGHGYASEAALAVVDYARHTIGLKRLVAITTPGNAASERVLAKVGMAFVKMVYLTENDPGTRYHAMDLV